MITARAPVRVCDMGGWTDTWFGGPGRVVHIAVGPGVEVTVSDGRPGEVSLDLASFAEKYTIVPGRKRAARHPLIEAAVDLLVDTHGPGLEIAVRSDVPPGCGTGTSAAVGVAAVAALSRSRGEPVGPSEAARLAHRLEVDVLGGESGVQDQIAAAWGGINYVEITDYPEAEVRPLPQWPALADHLTLVYLGRAHQSSAIHRRVIERVRIEGRGPFEALRAAASAALAAVVDQDLDGFGAAMTANTSAQDALDHELVGEGARRLMATAAVVGAIGWKVNGAGGDGGSVSILSPTPAVRAGVQEAITALGGGYRVVTVFPTGTGVTVEGGL